MKAGVERRTPMTDKKAGVVRVPIGGSERSAVIDLHDYEKLMAAGLSNQWFILKANGHEYVRCRDRRSKYGMSVVARRLLDPPPKAVIRYRNGDGFDLRRANLILDWRGSYWPTLLRRLRARTQQIKAAKKAAA